MRHDECCKDVVVIHKKRRQIKLTLKDVQDMIAEASKFMTVIDESKATVEEPSSRRVA